MQGVRLGGRRRAQGGVGGGGAAEVGDDAWFEREGVAACVWCKTRRWRAVSEKRAFAWERERVVAEEVRRKTRL